MAKKVEKSVIEVLTEEPAEMASITLKEVIGILVKTAGKLALAYLSGREITKEELDEIITFLIAEFYQASQD